MKRVFNGMSALEEGKMLWRDVTMVMNAVCVEHQKNPVFEELDVHLLSESIARMFPKYLVAQHGFLYHLASREEIRRHESPGLLRTLWREVIVYFKQDDIRPKLGYLKPVPYSWLLHERSGTIIDVVPVGGELGVDPPVRHPPHPDRLPYNLDPNFELLKGKLPTKEKVKEVWKNLESWVVDPDHGEFSHAICCK